jgi:uncharacterized membrane protein YeaQ/YmgE (transglycosylase-associated protein family)
MSSSNFEFQGVEQPPSRYRPRTTSIPASTSSSFAVESFPTRSVSIVLSTATIWETFATESFERPVDRHVEVDCTLWGMDEPERPKAGLALALMRAENGGTKQMGILGWIVFGLIVGAIAKLLMPGRDPGGIIVTMLLGIAGAVIGGFVGRALGLYGEGEAAGFLMALVGAVVLLALYRMMVGRRTVARP